MEARKTKCEACGSEETSVVGRGGERYRQRWAARFDELDKVAEELNRPED